MTCCEVFTQRSSQMLHQELMNCLSLTLCVFRFPDVDMLSQGGKLMLLYSHIRVASDSQFFVACNIEVIAVIEPGLCRRC